MSTFFDDFTNYYFSPIVFIVGFTGNLFGMIVLSRKNLQSKLYMSHVYMYLLISDMFYLITQLPITNIQQSYPSINPLIMAEWFCKLWVYTDLALANTSTMILLYISVERLVAVKFPAKRLTLRKHKSILMFTIVITVINLIYYIPVYMYYHLNISNVNETNLTSVSCTISTKDNQVISWMYLVFGEALPDLLMILCTLSLCMTIFQSRGRTEANRNIRKDVRFTITSITLNLAFIALTLPISVVNFFSNIFVDTIFSFCNILFFSAYAVNFYFLFAFNSIFREEIFSLMRINHSPTRVAPSTASTLERNHRKSTF